MIEPNFSIKIEFIFQYIKGKFFGNRFVNSHLSEYCSFMFEIYQQQLDGNYEFIHLRTIFNNFTEDLYKYLYYKNNTNSNYIEKVILKYAREIEQVFSPEHLCAVQYLIKQKSCYIEKNATSTKLFEIITELYELWFSLQAELNENKLLLQENQVDFDLDIDRLLWSEISEIENKISNLENKILAQLNNFYQLYINKDVFLEITTNHNDIYHSLLVHLLLKKYARQAELAGWDIGIYSEWDNSIILEIRGCFVFEDLHSEVGIHQVDIYKLDNILNHFETDKSYFFNNNQASIIENKSKYILAQVNIIPQPNCAELPEIKPKDLKIKERIVNPGCGVQSRFLLIAHKPTKIEAVICDRFPSKALAMKLLSAKLYSYQLQQNQIIADNKSTKIIVEENLFA